MEGFYWDACGCSLGRRHGGLLLGQLRRLGGEERLCAWRRHGGLLLGHLRMLGGDVWLTKGFYWAIRGR